jgi:hypothetical protein
MPDLSSALHLAVSELTLAVGALVLLIAGAYGGRRAPRIISLLSVILLIAAAGLAAVAPLGVTFGAPDPHRAVRVSHPDRPGRRGHGHDGVVR